MTSRLTEVDFSRGLAVFLMMFVHTLWMYADQTTQEHTWLGAVVHFMGKGTAAFLVMMGISFIITKQQSLRSALLRGLLILIFAYFMNFLKFIVPIEVFGTMPESFISAYGWHSPLSSGQLSYILMTGDILQMAGIAFILLGLIRHFFADKYSYLVIGLLVASVSQFVRGFEPGVAGLDYLSRLFFSDHYQVYFPVFPWISFILFGMFFGRLIQEKGASYMKGVLRFGIASLIVGGALMYLDFDYHFGNFFHLGLGGVLYLLGITLILFRVIYAITLSGRMSALTRFFSYLSARVTSVYIIQWTLICWGMGFIGFQTQGVLGTVLLMPLVVCFTLLTQMVKDEIVNRINTASTEASAINR